ncbi:DUF2339 domain-containing protein [Bryocella elongata]|uniref:DUF2339 domain-containing protein n=1 Tax=Bryocella elongata TaxID=863522 RepID=UPI0038990156
MLPLAAVYAWVYQRLFASEQSDRVDRIAETASAWFALGTVATLLYFSLRPAWVSIGAAVLSIALLLLARVLQRSVFSDQAFAIIAMTAGRAIAFNVFSMEPLAAKFWEGRLFTVGITCVLLLAALPIAFSIRRQQSEASIEEPAWRNFILRRPEQMVFFAPLAILIVLIAVQLRAGMITVGWSALGLLTFLFALAVGERSFRLSGLGLLLVCVGKIIAVDIWHASPTDRYVTLIVMGAALLLVSFLYSRYRETILELL